MGVFMVVTENEQVDVDASGGGNESGVRIGAFIRRRCMRIICIGINRWRFL